jgi:RNA polymerase sigma-70 factor (ECF subfamily)
MSLPTPAANRRTGVRHTSTEHSAPCEALEEKTMGVATDTFMNTSPTLLPTARRYQPSREEGRLIAQILEGRRDLFGDLLHPHLTDLFRLVRVRMRYGPEADDVIQTTIVKAFTRLEQFHFEASFRCWLMGIAIHEVLQWHRRRAPARLLMLDPAALAQLQVPDKTASPLADCERREMAVFLHRALARLPEKYQAVIRLRDLEELSVRETAQLLQLSIPAVKTRHRRARLEMLRFLAATRRASSTQAS